MRLASGFSPLTPMLKTKWNGPATSTALSATSASTESFAPEKNALAPGEHIHWIIDYKTSTHSALGLESFFMEQKEEYKNQLEAYATVLRLLKGPGHTNPLRLVLPLASQAGVVVLLEQIIPAGLRWPWRACWSSGAHPRLEPRK